MLQLLFDMLIIQKFNNAPDREKDFAQFQKFKTFFLMLNILM